jgi:hypothetical protein
VVAGERGLTLLADLVRADPQVRARVPETRGFLGYGLGLALRDRYQARGDAQDARAAMARLREVAEDPSQPADLLVGAGTAWADLCVALGDLGQAGRAYRGILAIIPRLAWRGMSRDSREFALGRWPGLGVDAAACALATGDPGAAVELLEQARGVLWGQLVDGRSAASRLRATHPALADRLALLSATLDAKPVLD